MQNSNYACRKMGSLKLQEMAFPKFYISKISPGPPNNAITIFECAELFSPPQYEFASDGPATRVWCFTSYCRMKLIVMSCKHNHADSKCVTRKVAIFVMLQTILEPSKLNSYFAYMFVLQKFIFTRTFSAFMI